MSEYYIGITNDEAESFADFIQEAVRVRTKYMYTDLLDDVKDEEERREFQNDCLAEIDRYWKIHHDIASERYSIPINDGKSIEGTAMIFDTYDDLRKFKNTLDFDIFSVLYDETWSIDNPIWLHNVMVVWGKIDAYEKAHK